MLLKSKLLYADPDSLTFPLLLHKLEAGTDCNSNRIQVVRGLLVMTGYSIAEQSVLPKLEPLKFLLQFLRCEDVIIITDISYN